MVRALFIQSLKRKEWRVLYSRFYGPESVNNVVNYEDHEHFQFDHDVNNNAVQPVTVKRERDAICRKVCTKVQEAYAFRVATTQRSNEADLMTLVNEGTMPSFEFGFCRFSPAADGHGDPDAPACIVVWIAAINCAVSLVCEDLDNRLTAEEVLKVLAKYLQRYCNAFSATSGLIHKLEAITLIIEQFLPMGQLLIINNGLERQFKRELEAKMKMMI